MRVEPLYGLPVEEPGDVEGWSINSGQSGDLLADAIAAELDRIDGDITAFAAALAALPRTVQAGNVRLPFEIFTTVNQAFYNGVQWRGAESIVFERQFESVPAVVLVPNNTSQPGFSIECTVSNVTTAGFTARLSVNASFSGTFISRWIAMEPTQ